MYEISRFELAKLWDVDLNLLNQLTEEVDLGFEELSNKEFQATMVHVIDTLQSDLIKAGQHRKGDWHAGWQSNFVEYVKSKSTQAAIPGYFEKSKFARWQNRWILPNDSLLELKLLGALVDSTLSKYSKSPSAIYEFGCGTGQHLFRLRKLFPESRLIGLDWATSSQDLIKSFSKHNDDSNLSGLNFDFFSPREDLLVPPDSIFLTVAALEQVHDNHNLFVNWIMKKKPKYVINIEPIEEFLDPSNLLDSISIKYFRKRNYLKGYFQYLLELEKQEKLTILDRRRTMFGSLFIEGYSVVVWKPH